LDQSGRGNDLTAAGDPALLPAATPTGRPAIAFDGGADGSGDKLERTGTLHGLPAGAADRSMFVVARYASAGYGGVAYGASTGCARTFGLVVDPAGKLMVQRWCADYQTAVAGTGAGWLLHGAVLSGTTLTHYNDGAVIETRSGASFSTRLSRIVVGAELDASPYLAMDVAAVLVYDRALPASERAQVEAYLREKYLAGRPPPPVASVSITSPADGAV